MLLHFIDPLITDSLVQVETYFRTSQLTFVSWANFFFFWLSCLYIKAPGCIPSPPAVSQAPGPRTSPRCSHLHTPHFNSLERIQIQPWYVPQRWNVHICLNRHISLYNILQALTFLCLCHCCLNKLDSCSILLFILSVASGQVLQFKLSDIGEGIMEVTVKEWYVHVFVL